MPKPLRFALMLPILSLLGACAPAVIATTTLDPVPAQKTVDPVFSPGQIWNVAWGDSSSDTLTVPVLSGGKDGVFRYSKLNDNGRFDSFVYYPVDSNPEFAHFSVDNLLRKSEKHCWVRFPSTVVLNEVRQGYATDRISDTSVYQYVATGDFGQARRCTVSRSR